MSYSRYFFFTNQHRTLRCSAPLLRYIKDCRINSSAPLWPKFSKREPHCHLADSPIITMATATPQTHRRYISSITSTSTHHLGSLQHPCHPHVANAIATNIKHPNENFFFHIFSIWINRVKSARGLSRAVIINLPSICINTPMTTIYHGDSITTVIYSVSTISSTMRFLRRDQGTWDPIRSRSW